MKSKRGSLDIKDSIILLVLAIAAIVGLLIYNSNEKKKAAAERREAEIARENRELAEKEERERRLKEEEEFERQRREARLAKERETAEREAADRERKRIAAEAEAEKQRQLDEMRKRRECYDAVLEKFKHEFCFAAQVPADDKPRSVAEETTFWCAFSSYPSEKRIFEVKAMPGGQMEVMSLSADCASESVDATEFANRLKTERSVTASSSGRVFLTGVKSPSGMAFPIPSKGNDFRIDEVTLKDFYPAYVALRLRVPGTKFRVRIVSNNSKTNIDMGMLGYSDTLDRGKIEKAIGGKISANAQKGIPQQSKVKRRKLRRTAKLYDGKYVKKGMDGVTLVPRVFEFIGTSNYKSDDYRARNEFERKWKALHDQAMREDEEEQRLEEEYRAALEKEREANENARAKAASISGDERAIEAALLNCKIIVEHATLSSSRSNASPRH